MTLPCHESGHLKKGTDAFIFAQPSTAFQWLAARDKCVCPLFTIFSPGKMRLSPFHDFSAGVCGANFISVSYRPRFIAAKSNFPR